jgi:hypothetical protein
MSFDAIADVTRLPASQEVRPKRGIIKRIGVQTPLLAGFAFYGGSTARVALSAQLTSTLNPTFLRLPPGAVDRSAR